MKKILRWTLQAAILVIIVIGFAVGGLYFYFCMGLPEVSSLKDYHPPIVTTVFSDNGSTIAEFYKERRIAVPLNEMSDKLVNAFIAAEDARFYEHMGIDVFSILRAFIKNIKAGAIVQGGSTITQQVAKSFFLTPEKSYKRKIKETILAFRINKSLTKDEILYLYLNQIYLGHGAYGVEAAAENYFGKSAKDLTLAECSVLAGLPQAPSRYSPAIHLKMAKARQKYVLDRMVKEDYITRIQAVKAFKDILVIKPGLNRYLNEVPYFSEYIRRYIEENYGSDMLYKEGLKIYTTVNVEMQHAALAAMQKGLRDLDKRQGYRGQMKHLTKKWDEAKNIWKLVPEQEPAAQSALLCIEAGTGHVKAMAGGNNFIISQFNRAVQSTRQPGSAFKPIIYSAAIDRGYTPATIIIDSPVILEGVDKAHEWKPRNYGRHFYGPTSLRAALAQSRNLVTIKIVQDIGLDYLIDYARKLGISSDLSQNLSLALGSSGISLLELTTAYSVFANHGFLIRPKFITKIVDRDGSTIEKAATSPERAIEKTTAYIMTSMLESVVKEGTGRRAKALGRPVAGKTGTTDDFHDAWFVGYTPQYITGVWVGFDQERSLGKGETGSRAASPIWLDFMKEALKDKPSMVFQIPNGIVFSKIDTETGLRATAASKKTKFECFKEGTEPTHIARFPDENQEQEQFFKSTM